MQHKTHGKIYRKRNETARENLTLHSAIKPEPLNSNLSVVLQCTSSLSPEQWQAQAALQINDRETCVFLSLPYLCALFLQLKKTRRLKNEDSIFLHCKFYQCVLHSCSLRKQWKVWKKKLLCHCVVHCYLWTELHCKPLYVFIVILTNKIFLSRLQQNRNGFMLNHWIWPRCTASLFNLYTSKMGLLPICHPYHELFDDVSLRLLSQLSFNIWPKSMDHVLPFSKWLCMLLFESFRTKARSRNGYQEKHSCLRRSAPNMLTWWTVLSFEQNDRTMLRSYWIFILTLNPTFWDLIVFLKFIFFIFCTVMAMLLGSPTSTGRITVYYHSLCGKG